MTRNIAASVHQRLLNKARTEGRPCGELLQYFALERFLYRSGISPYSNRFMLEGALMLSVWPLHEIVGHGKVQSQYADWDEEVSDEDEWESNEGEDNEV